MPRGSDNGNGPPADRCGGRVAAVTGRFGVSRDYGSRGAWGGWSGAGGDRDDGGEPPLRGKAESWGGQPGEQKAPGVLAAAFRYLEGADKQERDFVRGLLAAGHGE